MATNKNSPLWKELQKLSSSLRRQSTKLRDALPNLTEDTDPDYVNALLAIQQERQEWNDTFQALSASIDEVTTFLRERWDESIDTFSDHLRRELVERGCTVFGDSSAMFVDGVVNIEADPKKGKVSLNGKVLRDLRIGHLASAIRAESSRLRDAAADPMQFVRDLLGAYESVVSQRGLEFGTQIKTMELLPVLMFGRQQERFRQNPTMALFLEYPSDQFRADLHALLASPNHSTEDCKFCYSSGSTTDGAVFMFVPALERTAYIGRIWFESYDDEGADD